MKSLSNSTDPVQGSIHSEINSYRESYTNWPLVVMAVDCRDSELSQTGLGSVKEATSTVHTACCWPGGEPWPSAKL